MRFGLREVGGVIILVTVVMGLLILSFVDTLVDLSQESCTCQSDACGMVRYETPPIVYAGLVGVCVTFFVGMILVVKGGSLFGQADRKKFWLEKLRGLEEDEKTVYKLIVDSGGTLFQSEVVERVGWSKVKVTRTLDRLEARRLLERRRRGLTNILVLRE